MKGPELTTGFAAATSHPMMDPGQQKQWSGWRAARAGMMLAGCAMALSGCISVNAPDKPIVIELNINISQKVIYQLAPDAANTIESNPEIF